MSKNLDLGVEQDHIESLTRANRISALSELIWNSLDADSTDVKIDFKKNAVAKYDPITIFDNGHGLSYDKASEVFSKLGGSEKNSRQQALKVKMTIRNLKSFLMDCLWLQFSLGGSGEENLRYEYIKEKLNLNQEGNQEGLEYYKSKYVEYLPEKFDKETE